MKKNQKGFAIWVTLFMAVLVIVGIVGTWTIKSSIASSSSPAKNRLFLIGGSQLARTSNNYNINKIFNKLGWLTSHDAKGGRDFQEALVVMKTTRDLEARRARVIVIALGLNNDHNTKKEFTRNLDNLYQYIKSVNTNNVQVYMVNYAAFHRNPNDWYRVKKIAKLNSWLKEYAKANHIRIINWNAIAAKNNKKYYNNKDGTHPNKTGQKALINLIKKRIGNYKDFK
ncbi:SGNH/GDSL hydrolase family protein [Candidatus Saccharibacteria bacterium]|nr:SGNH/GDSL hydrolase family protein [Candidatus Saccharibacteria bacterium]